MGAYYLQGVLHPQSRKEVLARLLAAVKKYGLKFDAVAFRGHSGLLAGPMLADALDKPMLVVRKEAEKHDSHSSASVEASHHVDRFQRSFKYVIVDDLVGSGRTVRGIVESIEKASAFDLPQQSKRECVGVLVYHQFDKDDYLKANVPVYDAVEIEVPEPDSAFVVRLKNFLTRAAA